jgi:Fic family protein
MALHITYVPNLEIRQRLDDWDNAVRRYPELDEGDWRLVAVWPAARGASISGSTGIEGNPLRQDEVEAVLAGAAVAGDREHVREVENYNRALRLARDAIRRPDFAWTHQLIHDVNATIMDGLADDTRGNYRVAVNDDVNVGSFYIAPAGPVVPALMGELVAWLNRSGRQSPLVRSALVHLNIAAIHPFLNGNGRTARVIASMVLMEDGIRAPELISIEAYLRRNVEAYYAALRATIGPSYDPENHPVSEWLEYYTAISLDRVELRNRILDATPSDIGVLYAALADRGEPVSWAPALLAARVTRVRTTEFAAMTHRTLAPARTELGRMVTAGWLEAQGQTRGRWYAPSERLQALLLRVPLLMRRLTDGAELGDPPPGPAI